MSRYHKHKDDQSQLQEYRYIYCPTSDSPLVQVPVLSTIATVVFFPLTGGCSEGLDAFRLKLRGLFFCTKYSTCMYGHTYTVARVWINRVRLSILLVVS